MAEFFDEKKLVPKETFTKLCRAHHSAPKSCAWTVFTYLLSSNQIMADGTPNPFRGVILPLGAFPTEKEAKDHAQELQERSGHPSIFVAKYAYPIALVPGDHSAVVIVDKKDERPTLLAREEYEKDKKLYERQQAYAAELEAEAKEETDPDSLEHLKRKVYLAVKHQASLEVLKMELSRAEAVAIAARVEAQAHLKNHPEHDIQLIPFLMDKLKPRGEEELARAISTGYIQLRSELGQTSPLPAEILEFDKVKI